MTMLIVAGGKMWNRCGADLKNLSLEALTWDLEMFRSFIKE